MASVAGGVVALVIRATSLAPSLAGGMFYLTVTDLVPTAEAHQFQRSAAIAVAAGFLLMFALAHLS